jgi:diguanylate cyclase (GGDEF)-like protein
MGVTIDFRLWRRGASSSPDSRKKSGAQHRGSGKRFECGVHGAITDVASRWVGEEFLVLMPHAPEHAAKAVADRILLRIRNWVGQLYDAPFPVTATLAVSEIHYGESFESALSRADQALYRGKQQGRNQVVLAG